VKGLVDILPQHLAIVWNIVKTALPEGSEIYVFGSRALGKTRRSSDLDLAIDAGHPLTKAQWAALTDGFDESNLPYRVDVIDLLDVSENFKAIIDQQKVRLPQDTELYNKGQP
jgi:uncharacterized protein